MNSLMRDIAAQVLPRFAHDGVSLTAGGGGDNAESAGTTIDTMALASRCESVCFALAAKAVLAASATLALVAKIEHSDTGSSWADLVPAVEVLRLTGGTGGSTERGTGKIGVALEYAKRYIRVSVKPDLSAGSTDTAVVDAIAVFGGAQQLPVA